MSVYWILYFAGTALSLNISVKVVSEAPSYNSHMHMALHKSSNCWTVTVFVPHILNIFRFNLALLFINRAWLLGIRKQRTNNKQHKPVIGRVVDYMLSGKKYPSIMHAQPWPQGPWWQSRKVLNAPCFSVGLIMTKALPCYYSKTCGLSQVDHNHMWFIGRQHLVVNTMRHDWAPHATVNICL